MCALRLRLRRLLLLATTAAAATPQLHAYVLRTDASDIYVVKWYNTPVPIEIRLPTTATLSDGNSQASAVAEAITIWNAELATIQLTGTIAAVATSATTNQRNEIVMSDQIHGDDFPEGALAVTVSYSSTGNAWSEADIVFNRTYTWDSYRGSLLSAYDIRRVAIHELGHLVGLDHPDEAGQFVTAIMNSHISNLDNLRSDDINGTRQLYGSPGFIPENDAFNQATDLSSTGTVSRSVSGTNIRASSEPGEPAHAAVLATHSVWWKWTAPGAARLNVDTLGSDFDTVLAVYTGTSVDALTWIAGNDDEESTTDNPTPQRKRTSLVMFDAIADQTYYFAVDGWGDPDRFPPGSTGRIQFRLNFDTNASAPGILYQPTDRSTRAGVIAYFEVSISGTGSVSYRWLRKPAGTNSWEDVVDGNDYSGSTSNSLAIETRYSMNGDKFRCVISNDFGSITTQEAQLTVIRGSLPSISQQPENYWAEVGDPITLSVLASMTAPLENQVPITYQWYHNGAPIPGATQSVLTINSARVTDDGTYYAQVINASGSVNTRLVSVQITNVPLVIAVGDTRRVAHPNDPVALRVNASGTGALHYQWYHNGRPIAGATQASYDTTAASSHDAGTYWVNVQDDVGTRSGDPFFVYLTPQKTRIVPWGWSSFGHRLVPPTLDNAVAIATDHWSAIAIRADGTFLEWAGSARHDVPAPDLTSVVAMAKFSSYNVALLSNGSVVEGKWPTRMPINLNRVVAIARGTDFVLALRTNGTVVAWGEPTSQVANNVPTDLKDVVAIAAGNYHAVAVKRDGTITTWGQFQSGVSAAPPPGTTNIISAAAGANYTLVLKADGSLAYWGAYPIAPDLSTITNVVAIAGGSEHSIALHADGTVTGFGTLQATAPEDLSGVISIAAGEDVSLALVEDHTPTITSRLLNLSVRSTAGSGDQTLVMGFVISGGGYQVVVARGVGPGLQPYGIQGFLEDPQLTVYNDKQAPIFTNNDWDSFNNLPDVFAAIGAFPLPYPSKDAVLYPTLLNGAYSAHVTGWSNSGTGLALVEIYDVTKAGPTRFTNLSARTLVGSGENVLIAGFVFDGTTPKTLLIRAVGPSLAAYGLSPGSLLADPQFEVARGTEIVTINDNWSGAPELKAAFAKVGAFALDSDSSRDAATLVTLAPGAYTVKVFGVNNTNGVALVEIYEMP